MFLTLLISGLVLGCIYGLVGLGYSLIYKTSGMINRAQGQLMTLGAFLGLTFYKLLGLPFWLSLLLTMGILFFVGMLIQRALIRPLVARGVTGIVLLLSSIGVSYIIQSGEQIIWTANVRGFPSIFGVSNITFLGVNLQVEQLFIVAISFILMLALHLFMTKTRFGTSMRAAAMDEMASEACGINVGLSKGITWGLAAGLAACGGILLGPVYGVYLGLGPTMGNKGFSGAVVGGFGNMYGAMIGGVLLGVVETIVAGFVSSDYKNMIAYVLLILCLFIKPTGILNESAINDV